MMDTCNQPRMAWYGGLEDGGWDKLEDCDLPDHFERWIAEQDDLAVSMWLDPDKGMISKTDQMKIKGKDVQILFLPTEPQDGRIYAHLVCHEDGTQWQIFWSDNGLKPEFEAMYFPASKERETEILFKTARKPPSDSPPCEAGGAAAPVRIRKKSKPEPGDVMVNLTRDEESKPGAVFVDLTGD